MFGAKVDMTVGAYSVHTTSGVGHSPEFWTERLVERLIHVSESAPPVIKQQAMAYREALQAVVLDGVRKAILSNHTTVINELRKAGMPEAAALVYELTKR